VAALAERYGVDDDAIAGQVRATIDELAAEGLYVETATH
jgi:DNA polymerase III epsilon subunit-like protein